MHPALKEVLTRLDRSRATLRAAVEAVPEALRDQPLDAGRWSVAGVVEHVALVDARFSGFISARIAEARAAEAAEEVDDPPLLPPDLEVRLADRSERRQAPDGLYPTGISCEAAWERAEATRAAFRDVLRGAEGIALSRVKQLHPRFGELSAYQWAGFLAVHESRHAEQIREIAAALDAGKSS